MTGHAPNPGAIKGDYHSALILDLSGADWVPGGAAMDTPDGVYVSDWFMLPSYIQEMSAEDLANRLGITGEDGKPVQGYEVGHDVEGVTLSYEGAFTPDYVATLALMRLVAHPELDSGEDGNWVIRADQEAIGAYRAKVAEVALALAFQD